MKLPYFNYYPRDFIADTRHLTYEQRGIYHDILDFMWIYGEDCTLPDEPKTIAGLLNVSPAKWQSVRAVLVEGFAPVLRSIDGHLVSKRLHEEYEKACKKSQTRAEAAMSRWHPSNKEGDANAMQMDDVCIPFAYANDMHPEADPDPDHPSPKEVVDQTGDKRAKKAAQPVDNFTAFAEEVWAAYPDRRGKKLNKQKFLATLKAVPARDWDAVLVGVENFSRSRQAIQGYAPDAFRWVRDGGWKEWQEPEVVKQESNGNGSNGKPTLSGVLTEIFRGTGDTDQANNHRRLPSGGQDTAYRRGA